MTTSYVVLRSDTAAVVVTDDDAMPRIVHWGPPVPDDGAYNALLDVAIPQGSLDVAVPMGILPEHARGWSAYGGISGHRDDPRMVPPMRVIPSTACASSVTASARRSPA